MSDATTARTLVAAAVESFGQLEALVNNAGLGGESRVGQTPEEIFDAQVRVNLKGTWAPMEAAIAHWQREREAGRTLHASVLNTSSGAGLLGNPGQAAYGAAKAGVAALTLIAAVELEGWTIPEIEEGMASGAFSTQLPLQIFAYADHGHTPEDADRHPQFPKHLLPGRLLELVRIRSGQVNGCEPCMSSRKVDSIDDGDIECLVDVGRREDLSERERLALRLVDLMATDHFAIDDDLVRTLAEVFTTAEIVELGQFCGQMIGSHRFMHMLDVFGDGDPVIRYDERQVGVTWDEARASDRDESEVAKRLTPNVN